MAIDNQTQSDTLLLKARLTFKGPYYINDDDTSDRYPLTWKLNEKTKLYRPVGSGTKIFSLVQERLLYIFTQSPSLRKKYGVCSGTVHVEKKHIFDEGIIKTIDYKYNPLRFRQTELITFDKDEKEGYHCCINPYNDGTCTPCALCLIRGILDPKSNENEAKHFKNRSVFVKNLYPIDDISFKNKEHLTRRIIRNFCGDGRDKALSYFEDNEAKYKILNTFIFNIVLNTSRIPTERISDVIELLSAALADINIFSGGPCQVDLMTFEKNNGWSHDYHQDHIKRFFTKDRSPTSNELPWPSVPQNEPKEPKVYSPVALEDNAMVQAVSNIIIKAFPEITAHAGPITIHDIAHLKSTVTTVRPIAEQLESLPGFKPKTGDTSPWTKDISGIIKQEELFKDAQLKDLTSLFIHALTKLEAIHPPSFFHTLGTLLGKSADTQKNLVLGRKEISAGAPEHVNPPSNRNKTDLTIKSVTNEKVIIVTGYLQAETTYFFAKSNANDDPAKAIHNELNETLTVRVIRNAIRQTLGHLYTPCTLTHGQSECKPKCDVCRLREYIDVFCGDPLQWGGSLPAPELSHNIRRDIETGIVEELFTSEAGYEGTVYPVVLMITIPSGDLPAGISNLLWLWTVGMVWLGGHGSTGGRFRLINPSLFEADRSNHNHLEALLLNRHFVGLSIKRMNDIMTKNLIKKSMAIVIPDSIKSVLHHIDDKDWIFSTTYQNIHVGNKVVITPPDQLPLVPVQFAMIFEGPVLSKDPFRTLLDPDMPDAAMFLKTILSLAGLPEDPDANYEKKKYPEIKARIIKGLLRYLLGRAETKDCLSLLEYHKIHEGTNALTTLFGSDKSGPGVIRFEGIHLIKFNGEPLGSDDSRLEHLIDHVSITFYQNVKNKFDTSPICGSTHKPLCLFSRFWLPSDLHESLKLSLAGAFADLMNNVRCVGGRRAWGYGRVKNIIFPEGSWWAEMMNKARLPRLDDGNDNLKVKSDAVFNRFNETQFPTGSRSPIQGENYSPRQTVVRGIRKSGATLESPPFSGYAEGFLTGKIFLRLTFIRPVIIPDTRDFEYIIPESMASEANISNLLETEKIIMPDGKEYHVIRSINLTPQAIKNMGHDAYEKIRKQHKRYHNFRLNGEEMLNGSSIRGDNALIFQILTGSCPRVLEQSHRPQRRMDATKANNKLGRVEFKENLDQIVLRDSSPIRVPLYLSLEKTLELSATEFKYNFNLSDVKNDLDELILAINHEIKKQIQTLNNRSYNKQEIDKLFFDVFNKHNISEYLDLNPINQPIFHSVFSKKDKRSVKYFAKFNNTTIPLSDNLGNKIYKISNRLSHAQKAVNKIMMAFAAEKNRDYLGRMNETDRAAVLNGKIATQISEIKYFDIQLIKNNQRVAAILSSNDPETQSIRDLFSSSLLNNHKNLRWLHRHDKICILVGRSNMTAYIKFTGPNKPEIKTGADAEYPYTHQNPDLFVHNIINGNKTAYESDDHCVIMDKTCERAIVLGDKQYGIPIGVVRNYNEMVETLNTNPGKLPNSLRTKNLGPLKIGDIVYYVPGRNGIIDSLTPTAISREVDTVPMGLRPWLPDSTPNPPCIRECPEGHSVCSKECHLVARCFAEVPPPLLHELCPLCKIFGSLMKESHLSFSPAHVIFKPEGQDIWCTLFEQHSARLTQQLNTHDAPVQGFWLNVHPAHTTEPKTLSTRKVNDTNANSPADAQIMTANNVTVKPLPAGTVMRAEIDFDSLSKDALGMVLYVLLLENHMAHMLGKGKAFGFGGYVIEIDQVMIRKTPFEWETLNNLDEVIMNGKRTLVAWFDKDVSATLANQLTCDEITRRFHEIPHIKALRTLLTVPGADMAGKYTLDGISKPGENEGFKKFLAIYKRLEGESPGNDKEARRKEGLKRYRELFTTPYTHIQ